MKLTAITIAAILLIATITSVEANSYKINNNIKATSNSGEGDSSVQVNINNEIGTNNGSTTEEGSTSTKVEIDQEGEGVSEVTINGKTWKQEGPGKISVEENTGSDGGVLGESDQGENKEDPENKDDIENEQDDGNEKEAEKDSSPFKFIKEFFDNLRNFFLEMF